jgi:prepilin-type N-terminal cleavage/methylation domain-containing protein
MPPPEQCNNEKEKNMNYNQTTKKTPTAPQNKAKRYRKNRGFTLLEILIVLAIIGVMAAALIPKIESAMNKSHDSQLVMDLTTLDSGARLYEIERGESPASYQVLIDGKYVPAKNYGKIENGKVINGHQTYVGELSDGTKVTSDSLGNGGSKTETKTNG